MFSVASLMRRMRWLFRSSIFRMALVLSAIFAAGMAIAIALSLAFGTRAVLDNIDGTLADLASSVVVSGQDADQDGILIRPLTELGDLPNGFTQVIQNGGGTVRLDADFRRSEDWRVLVTQDSNGVPIMIALPLDDSDDTLELIGGILWTMAGLVLVIVVILGFAVGSFTQRRLAHINTTLGSLAAGDLHARTGETRFSDDLGELARQVDNTAAELERLVAQTRNLSANLAHDLRTPLARLQARLEKLPSGEERSAALEEADRLSGIFEAIMRVARIEAGHGTEQFEMLELGDIVAELDEIFSAVVEDSGKTLLVVSEPSATVFADRKMLIQACANLIQNAVVHGGPAITLFAQDREIGVADNGVGVEPDHFDDILKPMVRLEAARSSDGAGLGLALVRAVAERHNAQLVLAPNDPQGLNVSLKFTNL